LAVERIRNIERRFHEDDAFKVTSRVIVLLTDGMQNRGKYEPQESAEVAAALGVKVYTIGAAPDYTEEQIGGLLFEPMRIRRPVEIDEESLQEVADITGGEYFRAKTESSLREIYAEIDRLERSVIEEERYNVYEELAHEWADVGGIRLPPPLLAALIAVALEIALAATRLRKIP
jgi:Ca-activated chloride channel family protein